MKRIRKSLWAYLLIASTFTAHAKEQIQDSTYNVEEDTEVIHLSPDFQKDLWNAFTMTPVTTPIEDKNATGLLNRALLLEWIGVPAFKEKPGILQMPALTNGFAKDVELWKSIHGRYRIIKDKNGHAALSGLDICALGQYLRPNEIKLRKMRELAAQARPLMDRLFPMDGLPRPIPSDTLSKNTK